MEDVASAFGAKSFNCDDDPNMISELISPSLVKETCLFNINTNRLFWHAGAGIDDPKTFDRHQKFCNEFGSSSQSYSKIIDQLWKKCLNSL